MCDEEDIPSKYENWEELLDPTVKDLAEVYGLELSFDNYKREDTFIIEPSGVSFGQTIELTSFDAAEAFITGFLAGVDDMGAYNTVPIDINQLSLHQSAKLHVFLKDTDIKLHNEFTGDDFLPYVHDRRGC